MAVNVLKHHMVIVGLTLRLTPVQFDSKLRTPMGRLTGSIPTEMQVRDMRMPGRRKMKMNSTGLLFIVIQFLMTRAKMLERLPTEQFQHGGFSFSSLCKKSLKALKALGANLTDLQTRGNPGPLAPSHQVHVGPNKFGA